MTYTVQQIVQSALRKVGVSDYGSAEEIDAIEALNLYIATIAADKDMWMQGTVPLSPFDNLSDTFDVPNEYANLLIYNTAIYIAPEYGVKVSPELAALAKYSMDTIRMQTFRGMDKRIPSNTCPR